jgi:hypothetical protein
MGFVNEILMVKNFFIHHSNIISKPDVHKTLVSDQIVTFVLGAR